MANAILFLGWDRPHVGREDDAYGFMMGEGIAYLESVQGRFFERMEVCALTAHGGDLNGFVILFGERPKLDELRRSDEFEAFVMKVGSLFSRVGTVPGVNLEGIKGVMARRKS
jgi:hypothetical protein